MSDYIPSDLIPNIPAGLPVSDVLRCSSVCKSWYDLITTSSFISLHLKLSTPDQESRLLVKYHIDKKSDGRKLYYNVFHDNQTFDEIAELNFPFTWKSKIIGSINGLLCLCDSERVFLWNPSLRKSLLLPAFDCKRFGDVKFGFCFLPETNDYMILKLSISQRYAHRYTGHITTQVDIYELSTNSWRNVSIPQVSYISLNSDPLVFLNGSLHWAVGVRQDDNSGKFGRSIVLFDMKNENVGDFSVPNCLDNDESYFNISAVKESLCLVHPKAGAYNIWVMTEYGVPDSWTMQFRIEREDYCLSGHLYFSENGEIILQSVLANDALVSYDTESHQFTKIGKYKK